MSQGKGREAAPEPEFPRNLGARAGCPMEPLRRLRLACQAMDPAYLPFLLMALILAMIVVAFVWRKPPGEGTGDRDG